MTIIVANQDRTADLGRAVRETADRLERGGPSAATELEIRAVSLQLSRTDEDYRAHLARLRQHCGGRGDVPAGTRRPGRLGGAWIRARLKLARLLHGPVHGTKPTVLPPDISALRLGSTADEAAFQREFLRLVRYREGVDTGPFRIPARPGLAGHVMMRFKTILRKVLHFQFDRMAFRQNLINSMLSDALEFEFDQRQQETAELKRRIAALEADAAGRPDKK